MELAWRRQKIRRISAGKCERNRALGRPRCRWEDNIRIDLTEIGWKDVD
jgi:hypothetical protein